MPPEECPVCFDVAKAWVTLRCGHAFCVDCISNIKAGCGGDVDPRRFGCPPCGEHSPSCTSRPCCDGDKALMKEWEDENPIKYRDWVFAECERSLTVHARCPMCRRGL